MGAHLRSIVEQCSKPGCSSRATQQLYNARNAPLERYCNQHAKPALAALKKRVPNQ
jgi:hypothetical protein